MAHKTELHLLLSIHLFLLLGLSLHLAAGATSSKTDLLALASFKSQISNDPFGVLSSWNESLHHCQWQGVRCGRRHADRVTALVLDSKRLSGYISPSLGNLTFLQRIGLSNNQLTGSIPLEIGYLGRLRFVNLSMNSLDGHMPSSLGNCSDLEVLSLGNNNLHGTIPSNLVQCKVLREINLENNFLVGGIPTELGLIPQLKQLILSVNNLTGSIPSSLGNLTSLAYLYLDQNDISGSIPSTLGNLSNLPYFFVSDNNLFGPIPSTMGKLSNAQRVYLDGNLLTGSIPSTVGNLTNLRYLMLDGNHLTGSIPHTMGDLSKLLYVFLGGNELNGVLPGALGKLQNLEVFKINGNNISGEIPLSLFNMSSMIDFEFGDNKLEGALPFDLCDALPNLQFLNLYGNQLKGKIPPSISNCSALAFAGWDYNHFSGTIPSGIGALQNLRYFTVRTNKLEAKKPHDWRFFDVLKNCTSLQILDLADNQLQGVMPSSVVNLSSSLRVLSLYKNPISGSIPPGLGKLTNIDTLFLDHMHLSGTIPVEIGNLLKLKMFDLSYNTVSGQIPSTFGNLTQMEQLNLNSNAFEGSIPMELSSMQVLNLLNLSNNTLTGKIPKEIMSLPLSISLDLSYNNLIGDMPPEIGKFKNLQSIHISNNQLHGELPSTIDGCQVLEELYLGSNLFEGTIPSSLSNLKGLQKLDISNNSFSGQVPEFMGRMNLQFLNISFNNFEGRLPNEGIFDNVSAIDVRENPKLCGGVPRMHLPQCISESPAKRHRSLRNTVLISSIVGSFVCFAIAISLLVLCYSRKRPQNNRQPGQAFKYELKHVSYNDILRATENFSSENLIGRGTFGSVYKANMVFESMTTVAVKVLNLEAHGALKSFFSECEALRNVRHRNLIKVLSSCSSTDHQGNDFKALVFEFMPNGSLETWLHPNLGTNRPFRSLSLTLTHRLKIANNVAEALDYLHYHGPAPIVHCDLKPSNVLLDDDMTAHVGDFGLARFSVPSNTVTSQSMASSSGIKGSIGYIPPEYGMGGRPSIEGDVYSYGILLLEMFTGVSPTEDRFRDGLNLHKHVEKAFPEQVTSIIDSKLLSELEQEDNPYAPENVHGCLALVIQCALLCSKESPKERISIKDVAKELNSAQRKLLRS